MAPGLLAGFVQLKNLPAEIRDGPSMLRPASETLSLSCRQTRRSTSAKTHQFSCFDPDADGLTSEEQAVYDPAASAFVLEEGVCTALPHLSTVITTSDPRLPDENLPHSYKFTCTDNCSPPVCE